MVCNIYAKRGFVVTAILADPEFKHLENSLNKSGDRIGYMAPNGYSIEPSINVTGENEHVEEAERQKSTVKEGV